MYILLSLYKIAASLEKEGSIGFLSKAQPVDQLFSSGYYPSMAFIQIHIKVIQRQYIMLLDGEIEIETSLGDKK